MGQPFNSLLVISKNGDIQVISSLLNSLMLADA